MKKNPKDKKPETGGAPKPPEVPKPVNDESVSFSFHQLSFERQFTSENRKYVRYFVDNEHKPYFVDMYAGEFDDYFRAYKDLHEKAIMEEQGCLCDTCSPITDLIDEIPMAKVFVDDNGEETGKEEQHTIKIYFVWDLIETLKVGGLCKIEDKPNKK